MGLRFCCANSTCPFTLAVGLTRRILDMERTVCLLPQAGGTTNALVHGGHLVVSRPEGSLVAFDLEDGQVIPGAYALSESGGTESNGLVLMKSDSTGVNALFDQRVVRFDSQGRLIGMDAVENPEAYSGWIGTRDCDFIIDSLPRNVRDGSYHYLLHRLDPRAGYALSGPSMDLAISRNRVVQARAFDGWFIMSTSSTVLVIPIPIALSDVGMGSARGVRAVDTAPVLVLE